MNPQYLIALAAIGMMWLFLILGHVEISLSFLVLTFASLIWKKFNHIKYSISKKMFNVSIGSKMGIETFDDQVSGIMVNKISKFQIVGFFSNFTEQLFRTNLRSSGVFANPNLVGKKSGTMFFLSLIVSGLFSVYAVVTENYILTIVLITPVILLFYPVIQLKLASSDRKSRIDDELAYFVTFASAMQDVGRSLQSSFISIVHSGVFPQIEKESNVLNRNISLFSEDPLVAINNMGLTHPNSNLRDLLLGYVSISKGGGDAAFFLKEKANDFFNHNLSRLQRYSDLSAEIGSAMIVLLTMLPVLLMVSAFLMDSKAVGFISMISFIMLPMITMGIIMMTHLIQPRNLDSMKFRLLSIPIGLVAGIVVYAISVDGSIATIFGIMFVSGSNYVMNKRRINEIASTDKYIGSFMRDLTESVKVGSPINVGLGRLVKTRKYNAPFDRLLKKISYNLYTGNSLSSSASSSLTPSYLGRMTFFVLGKLMDAGGGNSEIMENLTVFVNKIKNEKQAILGKLQLITMLGYFSPILMVFLSITIQDMFDSNFAGVEALLQDSPVSSEVLTSTPEFLGLINMLTVMTSLGIGISVSKITTFGFANTLPLLIVSVLTLVAIVATPFIQTLV